MTPKEAIERVRGDFREMRAAYYDHLNEDDLVKEIGETNAKKVQKHFLNLAKQADKIPTVNFKPSGSRKGERTGTMNSDEFRDQLAELKKKG